MINNVSSSPSVPQSAPQRGADVARDTVRPNAAEVPAVALPGAKAKAVQEPQKPAFDAKEAQDRLNEAVERMNEHMRKNAYNLAFSVDKEVDKVVVKVTNLETGDVVRQIPNETALRVAHNIEDLRGLLQDKTI